MNFEPEIVKKYLPLLLKNMATGKDFDFDYERDFKPGYERNKEALQKDKNVRAAIYTPAYLVRRMTLMLAGETGWFTPLRKYPDCEVFMSTYSTALRKTFIEPACGEAPFICMRYDAVSGEPISILERDGILDQKFRNGVYQHPIFPMLYSGFYDDAKLAVKSVYGTEKHIPSLIIARMNVLLTFIEYTHFYFSHSGQFKKHPVPEEEHIREIAEIICWNFWQMDFLNPQDEVIKDWTTGEIVRWKDFAAKKKYKDKQEAQLMFDF